MNDANITTRIRWPARGSLATSCALVALLAPAGCSDKATPGEQGKPAAPASGESGNGEGAATANECTGGEQSASLGCRAADGRFRCCLTGCVPAETALPTEAFALRDAAGGAVEHAAERDGPCVVLSAKPSAPRAADEDGEGEGGEGEGAGEPGAVEQPAAAIVAVDVAKLPAVAGEPIALAEPALRFTARAWWCADPATCAGLVGGPDAVKVLVVRETELLGSEARELAKCVKTLGRGDREVVVEHLVGGASAPGTTPRARVLSRWLDAFGDEERAAIPLDEAVLHRGISLLVRWQPPEEKVRRGKTKRYSRGTDALGVVLAAPGEATREFAWSRGMFECNAWTPEEPLWITHVVDAALAARNSPQGGTP